MSLYHFLSLVGLILLLSCRSTHIPKQMITVSSNGLSAADKAVGWQSLFNGHDMNQWRVYRETGIRGWKIEDGCMIALGLHGNAADIITKDTFGNLELYLEWNISSGGNSGIFFNVREGEGLGSVYLSGPEYQLLDDAAYRDEVKDSQLSGSNYDMHAPSSQAVRPAGQWNTSRLIVDEGHVEHWLNGIMVVSYDIGSPSWKAQKVASKWREVDSYAAYPSGHIALQDHGNQIRFRNLKIRRL